MTMDEKQIAQCDAISRIGKRLKEDEERREKLEAFERLPEAVKRQILRM